MPNTIRNTSTKDSKGTRPLNMFVNYKQSTPVPIDIFQLTGLKNSNQEVFAVKHSPSTIGFALIIKDSSSKDSDSEIDGLNFQPGLNCLSFMAAGEAVVRNTDIICTIEESD